MKYKLGSDITVNHTPFKWCKAEDAGFWYSTMYALVLVFPPQGMDEECWKICRPDTNAFEIFRGKSADKEAFQTAASYSLASG